MSEPQTMQLNLVNNDPTSTLFVTPDGEAMYSTETPVLGESGEATTDTPTTVSTARTASKKSPRTTVKRLNRYRQSVGHVETVVGVVEHGGRSAAKGTTVQLCENDRQLSLDIAPHSSSVSAQTSRNIMPDRSDSPGEGSSDDGVVGFPDENAWEFTGPNSTVYKWQMLCHCPVLILGDNSFTPLARYRRAKIGIVSRARRAFLEIMPAGLGIIDLIVVTFVGFMRQRVMADSITGPATVATIHDNFTTAASVVHGPSSLQIGSTQAPAMLTTATTKSGSPPRTGVQRNHYHQQQQQLQHQLQQQLQHQLRHHQQQQQHSYFPA